MKKMNLCAETQIAEAVRMWLDVVENRVDVVVAAVEMLKRTFVAVQMVVVMQKDSVVD